LSQTKYRMCGGGGEGRGWRGGPTGERPWTGIHRLYQSQYKLVRVTDSLFGPFPTYHRADALNTFIEATPLRCPPRTTPHTIEPASLCKGKLSAADQTRKGTGPKKGHALKRGRPLKGKTLKKGQAPKMGNPQKGLSSKKGQARQRDTPQKGTGPKKGQAPKRDRPQKGIDPKKGQANKLLKRVRPQKEMTLKGTDLTKGLAREGEKSVRIISSTVNPN